MKCSVPPRLFGLGVGSTLKQLDEAWAGVAKCREVDHCLAILTHRFMVGGESEESGNNRCIPKTSGLEKWCVSRSPMSPLQ
mmetsp:Transcript_31833/g.74654  ORF Transcript_31833/g.74654 Transcript_31833/m.74654 type:complete len:81 (-) Transcript_31833:234-476(-)